MVHPLFYGFNVPTKGLTTRLIYAEMTCRTICCHQMLTQQRPQSQAHVTVTVIILNFNGNINLKQEYRHCDKKLIRNPIFLFDFRVIPRVVNVVRPSPLVDNTARWSLFTALDLMTEI